MLHCIDRIFEPLLRFLWPTPGRHRSPRQYLAVNERRQEARQQRARRRARWLAVHGVDIGPRFIHGVEVTA